MELLQYNTMQSNHLPVTNPFSFPRLTDTLGCMKAGRGKYTYCIESFDHEITSGETIQPSEQAGQLGSPVELVLSWLYEKDHSK
jgi:hypothetical protein